MSEIITHRLSYGSQPEHFGDLYLPREGSQHPVVVLIHGGFWRNPYTLKLMVGLARDLARKGIAAWNIEYRRVGDEGGGWPGTLHDVAAATDHLQQIASSYALNPQRVIAVGHSAGGHLALWLAARFRLAPGHALAAPANGATKLKGVVSQAGAMDLARAWRLRLGQGAAAELLGGSPEEMPERYAAASPAELLPLGVPQVLIHGSADDSVPLIMSQKYARRARAAGDKVKLVELPNIDHFVLIDAHSSIWQKTVKEIQRLLES